MSKKVFVLGDSRTGTTSLHKLFMDYGFKSVHYYVDEVAEIAQRDGCEKHQYQHFRQFIETSGFDAFSDYPTRNYFRQLRRDYADAYFILSTRRDLPTWMKSMQRFFPDRPDVLVNMPHLSKIHLQLNAQIRNVYADAKNFIEICIDDGNEVNSPAICKLIGSEKIVSLKRLNAT
jgi:sulfotransferase family protein